MTIYSLDVLLSEFGTCLLFMSSFNCCFLTCIQISQKAGKVVWYSHLLKNFPQFDVIHTVKGFGLVNIEEIDFFFFSWNSLAFFMFQRMLAIGSLVPLPFLNPPWTSGSSWFVYYWNLAGTILSISLVACEMSAIVWYSEHSLALPFFGGWNEKWPFPVLWPLLSFPNLLAYSVQHFNGIIF